MKQLSLLFLFVAFPLLAQDIQWEKSYGGRQAEYLFDVQPTADYGFVLAGSSLSLKSGNKTEAANGDLDYWIWKMDENGSEDWQKSFGGSGSDLLVSIKNTNDGGFILGGTSNSSKGFNKADDAFGGNDYWIIKLNAKGSEEWQKTFGGSGQDDLVSICPTRDGGYIIGGTSASNNNGSKTSKSSGNMDYWIIKIDTNGKEEWQKSFGGKYADMLKTIAPTTDGGYILGGYSNSPESVEKAHGNYGSGSDFWVLKLDDKGHVQWQQTLGGDKDDQLFAVQQTYDKGYIIGGNSNSGATGNKSKTNRSGTDFWVIKLHQDGQMDWQETYDFGKVDILTSLVENDDHSFLIGGYARSEGKGDEGTNDYIAVKISEKGDKLWDRTVGSDGVDILRKVIETRDGGYLMAGTSNPSPPTSKGGKKGNGNFNNNIKNENIAAADQLNQEMDKTVGDATNKANDYYKEQTGNFTDGINKAIGQDKDSPIKMGVGAPGDAFKSGNIGENTLDKLGGAMAQSGPKPGLRASRDKKTNLGNNDFWVVKLKDKDKKIKDAKKIEAFPNPTQQYTNVIVGFDYTKGNISVYDLSGRQLQDYKVSERTIPVDLGNYPEGIYIVKVATDKGEVSLKVIKGVKQ
ncbi:MAG: T9SS type A sorting domain-containing protein [Flavobacterium sp.]|nr:T9SS type A sorting domain-containing protein [Flavobacterium sp.]